MGRFRPSSGEGSCSFTLLGYRSKMRDADKLTPADPSDLAAALAYRLRSGDPGPTIDALERK
jgi:hypothetical protein